MTVPDPRINDPDNIAIRSKTNPNGAAPLRYPDSIIDDTTDYLMFNIVKYEATGLGKRGEDATLTAGNPVIGNTIGKIRFTKNGQFYEFPKNDANIRRAAEIQGLVIEGKGKYTPTKGNRYNKKPKSLGGSIILPIPSNIQDGNSVNYGGSGLDFFTAQVLGVVSGAQYDAATKDIGTALVNALKRGTGVFKDSAVRDRFLQGLQVQAANLFGGNLTVSQLIARETGKVLDPNLELFFEGVNLRSFKFSFKMTPRNEDEAANIKRIIRTFKQNMAPQVDGIFLKTPNIFELTYMKGQRPHPFLHSFKQCALTDMSVNYTGDGVYSTYGDGTPVSMIMDLSFKELEPIYAGDYNDQKEGNLTRSAPGGVGY